MIHRVVLIKLKPEYANPTDRKAVVKKTKEVLPQAKGVISLTIGEPGDERTEGAWDLCFFLRFRGVDDIEPYRTDPVHRSYVDVFLKPLMDKIRVYNFEVDGDRLG